MKVGAMLSVGVVFASHYDDPRMLKIETRNIIRFGIDVKIIENLNSHSFF